MQLHHKQLEATDLGAIIFDVILCGESVDGKANLGWLNLADDKHWVWHITKLGHEPAAEVTAWRFAWLVVLLLPFVDGSVDWNQGLQRLGKCSEYCEVPVNVHVRLADTRPR